MSVNEDINRIHTYLDATERRLKNVREEIKRLKEEHRQLNTDLTTDQIATIMGKSKKTVYRRLDSGRLKSRKMIDVIDYMKKR